MQKRERLEHYSIKVCTILFLSIKTRARYSLCFKGLVFIWDTLKVMILVMI